MTRHGSAALKVGHAATGWSAPWRSDSREESAKLRKSFALTVIAGTDT